MNKLAKEKSPYLIQHQHNPVNWWPWSDEALQEAKSKDKPIFLSIGYSTCYWCHVMEGECFEDQTVADVLNENFVCIKVDREERPDIDALYMEAVVAVSGSGGWPLSVFLDAELKPFFGGTYFPKDNFVGILQKLAEAWKSNREQITNASEQLYDVLQVTARSTKQTELEKELWQQAFTNIQENFDRNFGGFGPAPKFPAAGTIRLLLRHYRRYNEEQSLQMALNTLTSMARGGLYDQVGGGFHRYSVDEEWLVPHFEKMLYDNALLIPAYLECWQLTSSELLKNVAIDSLEYLLREMRSTEGGFYCAQDAGAVGREGEFYVWSESELEDVLSTEDFQLAKEIFGIQASGNFESGLCIPRITDDQHFDTRFSPEGKSLCEKLLNLRNQRSAPHLDDKILTSWNALTISALCKGYQILGENRYLQAAQQAANFIKDKLYQDKELFRRYRQGDTQVYAFLEDYAFTIQALLDLYQSDANPDWLSWAEELQQKTDSLFWDKEEGGYHYSSDKDQSVIVRRKEHSDTALPSSTAVAATNLFRLSYLNCNKEQKQRGDEVIAAYSGFVKRFPSAFAYTLIALEYEHFGPLEVIVADEPESELSTKLTKQVFQQFQPTLVLARGTGQSPKILEGRQNPAAYICADGNCSVALTSANDAIKEIKKRVLQ